MIQQTNIYSSIKNQYVIPQKREQSRKLIVQPTIKINNGRKLKVKALIDSEYIHTTITRDIVKEKKILTKMPKKSFDIYNSDRSKNSEKTIKEFVLLELNSNRHIKQINTVVLEIKETDLFLGHNWLVEHNPEVNWKKGTI